MSFLSELKKRRQSLAHTSTKVTTVEGKTLLEELVQGQQLSRELSEENVLCPGFVVDTKPDLQVAEIIPFSLYLGSQDVTQDVILVRKHGLTHILSIGVNVSPLPQCANLSYTFIPALDLPNQSIDPVLKKALPLMEEIINGGGRVFVHCNAGVSRSPTVVIAYLMVHKKMPFSQAHALVKQRRPSSNPNAGFVEQLLAFEVRK